MYLREDISILVPALFSEIVAILTAPAVFLPSYNSSRINYIYGLARFSRR
jgi:hypothetical protein